MNNRDFYAPRDGGDRAFAIGAAGLTFGAGVLAEAGEHAAGLGIKRVALMTDARLASLECLATARRSLAAAGLDVVFYDQCRVEPTDASFKEAAAFAREAKVDGYVSVGGGSVIDTAKAANLYATHPADFLTYVNRPIGDGAAVPGPLKPHVACPTTAGTGSECTHIAIFDLLAIKTKTGIVSEHLRPDVALVDPLATLSMPPMVVISTAFDVLTHALESYTAKPYTARPRPVPASARPPGPGANPWSDMGAREALSILGDYVIRARDPGDSEAREKLAWAASIAGIAFKAAGCHLPHGMSYAVSGLVRDYQPQGYPDGAPMVPHGISVVVNTPAVCRFTAPTSPERHLAAAQWLGADIRNAAPEHAGAVLSGRVIALMREAGLPNGLAGLGYGAADIPALVDGAFPQQRLLQNSPRDVTREDLAGIYADAMRYW